MQPMALAGLFPLGAVGLSLRFVPPPRLPLAVGLLLAFAVLFLLLQVVPEQRRRVHAAVLLLMPPVALGLYYVASRVGAAQVMLVVWAACLFGTWTPRAAIARQRVSPRASRAPPSRRCPWGTSPSTWWRAGSVSTRR
mgnify:CR=1 FL=1